MIVEEESTSVLARKLVREAVVSASRNAGADTGANADAGADAGVGADGTDGTGSARATQQSLGASEAALVFLGGELHGQRALLKRGRNILGRDEAADLCLDYEGVSRQHAGLLWSESPTAFALEDLGSKNGIAFNGQRVTGIQAISHGDEIALGPVRLILELGRDMQLTSGLSSATVREDDLRSTEAGILKAKTGSLKKSSRSWGDTVIVVTSLVAMTALAAAWYWVKNKTF